MFCFQPIYLASQFITEWQTYFNTAKMLFSTTNYKKNNVYARGSATNQGKKRNVYSIPYIHSTSTHMICCFLWFFNLTWILVVEELILRIEYFSAPSRMHESSREKATRERNVKKIRRKQKNNNENNQGWLDSLPWEISLAPDKANKQQNELALKNF